MKPYEEEPEEDAKLRRVAGSDMEARIGDPFRRISAIPDDWSAPPLPAVFRRAQSAPAVLPNPPGERETWSVIGESWRRRHGRRWSS